MTASGSLNYNLAGSITSPSHAAKPERTERECEGRKPLLLLFLQPFYSLLAQDESIGLQRIRRGRAGVLFLSPNCSICRDGRDACFRHSKCSLCRLQHTQKPDCTVHVDSFYILQWMLTGLAILYLSANNEWTKDILDWLSPP